jgi:hypothetical protein
MLYFERQMSRMTRYTMLMVIEWIHHLFSSDTQRYPFYAQATYVPGAEHLHADPLGVYLDEMQREGIDKAVLVHLTDLIRRRDGYKEINTQPVVARIWSSC